MKKLIALSILILSASSNGFAASVCTVQESCSDITVICDGVGQGNTSRDLSRTLSALVNQGYKIVSSAGGDSDRGCGWTKTILVK